MDAAALDEQQIRSFLTELFEEDLHARRILSLSHATLGVIHAASLSVNAIGRALAWARGAPFSPKHATKQVDRLLSNEALKAWDLFSSWVPFVLAQREEALVALDWTDFTADDQMTLVASLVTEHGRATPLVWFTVEKSTLRGLRALTEDTVLQRLREVIPSTVRVTVLCDRGFEDQRLYSLMDELGFRYVVRFRRETIVTDADGERRMAGAWVASTGHARLLPKARVTVDEVEVGAVVTVKKKGMKEAWCLAANVPDASARAIVQMYARRFTTEESFRDVKDLRFGMGLGALHVSKPQRRDRLLLISALAVALLTLLGAAGEKLGMERLLKANTSKERTFSLFTQGAFYYQWMPTLDGKRLRALVETFAQLVREHRVFRQAFGLI
jgi:hypothetical protein